VIFGALVGGILTVVAGFEPGVLLGLFVVTATAAGASAVRRTAAYVVIPVPALAYFVVAVIAGLIHDRGVDTSRAILFVNAVQWIAGGFFWMCLATLIAIAITIGRWLMTGRAGYHVGGPWRGRLGAAWPAPDTARQGIDAGATRSPAARPATARPATARPATARSRTARPGDTQPDDTQPDDAAAPANNPGDGR
jgi:hypothetical protein